MGRVRGKPQIESSPSPEAPNGKVIKSPRRKGEAAVSYADKLHQLCKMHDPGYDKLEKLKHFQEQLGAKRVNQHGPIPVPHPSTATPSSPTRKRMSAPASVTR